MNVSLCVLNECSAEYADQADERGRRLECAVTVEQDLFRPVHFDTVRIALRGRLKTQINGRVSTTELNAHKQTLHWSNFYPMSPQKSNLKSRSQADLIFRLNNPQPVIPSLTLELTTDITCDHALGNRHQAKGRADIDYWFEATFWSQSGTKIFATAGAVHMPEPPALRLSPTDPAQQLSFPATQQSSASRILPFGKNSRHRKPAPGQQPHTLTVRLQNTNTTAAAAATSALGDITKPDPPFHPSRRGSDSKDRAKLRIPFRVQVSSPPSTAPHASEPLTSLTTRGALCDITAKWFVTRTLGSADGGGGKRKPHGQPGTMARCSVITQRERVVVPPFYEAPLPYCRDHARSGRGSEVEGEGEGAECCAEALLEVALPPSAIAPSVEMQGLGIAYELELKMVFVGIEGREEREKEKGGKPTGLGTVSLKIPVVLEGI